MIPHYQDLIADLEKSNITENTKEMAYTFLEIFKNEKSFDLVHKVKNQKCDVHFNSKNKQLKDSEIHLFSLYICEKHMTFYFRKDQAFFTENSESLTVYIKKPTIEKPSGDYYAKIKTKEDIKELINFVFVEKLGIDMTNQPNFNCKETANLYEFVSEEIASEEIQKKLGVYRDGQQKYRNSLLNRWDSKCAVTNLNHPNILVSSHIKPFKDSNSIERYDVENGILLSPNLDALFDQNLISFKDDGNIILSDKFTKEEYAILGISKEMKLSFVYDGMKKYLNFHRKEFKIKN